MTPGGGSTGERPIKGGDDAIWPCLEESMEPLACGRAFYFDARGDLVLKVGGGDAETESTVHEFVVCSRTLARCSSVFSAMLFGGFAESRPADATWSVDLPEDLSSPLFLVLSIVHCHFDIPKTLKQDELYQLLVVTEKYDMTKILRPWGLAWYAPYKDVKSAEGNEVMLWVSWELGHEETFRNLSTDLLLKSEVNENGELLDKDGVPLNTYSCLDPPGILDSILQTREDLIQQMLTMLRGAAQDAFSKSSCSMTTEDYYCSHQSDYCDNCGSYQGFRHTTAEMCIDMTFGAIAKQFAGIGLRDLALLHSTEPRYCGSVSNLLSDIKSMNLRLSMGHENCDPLPGLKVAAVAMVRSAPSPVTYLHLEYLRNQAKKTGI